MQQVVFPVEGMLSLVQPLSDGTITEVGLIGREGFSGVPLVLGTDSSPIETMVQSPGTGLAIAADAFCDVLNKNPVMRKVLLLYTQALQTQIGQTATCNARHKSKQRLARWLLETSDRMGGRDVNLTHEFISLMLGVRRAGVTDELSKLQTQGLLELGRNHIVIRDRKGLETVACECYRVVKAEYARLLP